MRQVRKLLWSPTTITWLRKGISFLILSSMGSGWNLSPSDMIIRSEGERRSGEGEQGWMGRWEEIGGRREERKKRLEEEEGEGGRRREDS